jgi:hypothetical protein
MTFARRHFLWRARHYDFAASVATLGSEVNNIVHGLDHRDVCGHQGQGQRAGYYPE